MGQRDCQQPELLLLLGGILELNRNCFMKVPAWEEPLQKTENNTFRKTGRLNVSVLWEVFYSDICCPEIPDP